MIISDISHLEVATEENSVVGGLASSNASANSYASGSSFAGTSTSTFTSANYYPGSYGYYYYQPPSYNASASSYSSAGAQ